VPSRVKRTSSWREPLKNVSRAKEFMERFGVQHAHPDEYLDPLTDSEAKDWDDLLKRMN
jgi:hypothetical protein